MRDESVAQSYLTYWNKLKEDPDPDPFQDWCSSHTPHPADDLPPTGVTPIFSPRARSKMLDWYGDRLEGANQTVMLTAAFGVTRKLTERFDNDRDFLRFLLMERKNRNEETQSMLERDIDTRIALGAALNRKAIELELDGHRLDEWFRQEEHYRRRGHVFYVHTKYMLLDVLTNDPIVFTFSKSTTIDDALVTNLQGGNFEVVGVLDGGQSAHKWSPHKTLLNEGAKLRRETLPNNGKLHHKLIVLDDHTVIGGSFNYTGPANQYNDENLFLVGDPNVAAFFKAEVKRVFESNTLSADFH